MIENKKRERLTSRLRAKRIPVRRTQVIDLDHNLVGAREIGRQSPACATGGAGAGAPRAAIDGLGDGSAVAGAAVPGAGGTTGIVARTLLGERGGGASGLFARGGGSGVGVRGAGTGGLGR